MLAARAQDFSPGTAVPKAGPVLEQGRAGVATDPAPVGISSSAPLRAFDVVQVSVFQEPELDTRTRITEDGTVVLPLIGAVKIGGKTLRQATAEVTALYAKDYLVHPEVTIALLEHGAKEARFIEYGDGFGHLLGRGGARSYDNQCRVRVMFEQSGVGRRQQRRGIE